MQFGGQIDYGNPVSAHSLNRDRVLWLYGLPQWSGGGTWFDLCKKTNGTLTNGPTWTPTPYGAGVSFDGSDDTVTVPSIPVAAFATGSTYAAWAWTTSTASVRGYVGDPALPVFGDVTGNCWLGWGVHGGVANFMYAGGGPVAAGAATLNDGRWHRITATHDRATGAVRLFADGVADGAGGTTGWDATFPAINRIGRGFSAADVWNGLLADVCVWSRPLSADEVRSDYDQSRRRYPDLLRRVRPWSFGGSVAATAATPSNLLLLGVG